MKIIIRHITWMDDNEKELRPEQTRKLGLPGRYVMEMDEKTVDGLQDNSALEDTCEDILNTIYSQPPDFVRVLGMDVGVEREPSRDTEHGSLVANDVASAWDNSLRMVLGDFPTAAEARLRGDRMRLAELERAAGGDGKNGNITCRLAQMSIDISNGIRNGDDRVVYLPNGPDGMYRWLRGLDDDRKSAIRDYLTDLGYRVVDRSRERRGKYIAILWRLAGLARPLDKEDRQ